MLLVGTVPEQRFSGDSRSELLSNLHIIPAVLQPVPAGVEAVVLTNYIQWIRSKCFVCWLKGQEQLEESVYQLLCRHNKASLPWPFSHLGMQQWPVFSVQFSAGSCRQVLQVCIMPEKCSMVAAPRVEDDPKMFAKFVCGKCDGEVQGTFSKASYQSGINT